MVRSQSISLILLIFEELDRTNLDDKNAKLPLELLEHTLMQADKVYGRCEKEGYL